jgi:hypothetical protein
MCTGTWWFRPHQDNPTRGRELRSRRVINARTGEVSDVSANEPSDSSAASESAPVRAGRPRLVIATDGHAPIGSPEAAGIQQGFALVDDVVTIGSAETQDVRLPGLEPEHGVIRRDAAADEWVYSDVRASTGSRVDGVLVESAGLHHGDRIELGAVTLVFQRAEAADHGRPDGGREGGDFAGGGSGPAGDASELG